MRILNENTDQSLRRIIVYLTMAEALELRDSLISIIEKPFGNHSHVLSEDYKKEVTICIYDPLNMESFDKRSENLIQNDDK